MTVVRYHEVFRSIQGETTEMGKPCIFIRLSGCPIGCSYCDTTGLSNTRASIETLMNKVKDFKWPKRVCITGGEPLLYRDGDLYPLVYELQDEGYEVTIETSGCIKIPDDVYNRSFRYIMDVKCPSSRVSHKNVLENLLHLSFKDEVVFVIADRNDYDYMRSVLKHYPTQATILLSPMFDREDHPVIGEDLVQWMLDDRLDYRVQIQMHKCLGVK